MSDDAASDQRTPVEQALDVLVYAPIGLLFERSTILPQLVEKGRDQVSIFRTVGRFAVEQGRVEAARTATRLGDQAADVLDLVGQVLTSLRGEPPPPPGSAGRAASTNRAPAQATAGGGPVTPVPGNGSAPSTTDAPSPEAPPSVPVTELAIPDYDGLSASHVVNRLGGLTPEELEAVRRYESANRGRKTILSKIAQLQSG